MKYLNLGTYIRKISKKRVLILILFLIVIWGLASIYNYNWLKTIVSGISIEDIEPVLIEDGRYIIIKVKASGNFKVDIANIYINQLRVVTYTIDYPYLNPNESATIKISYYWLQGNTYEVRVTTAQQTQIESIFTTPIISLTSSLNITQVASEVLYPGQPAVKMNFYYNVAAYGFSSVYSGLFLCKSYQNEIDRPIYLFYDYHITPQITLQRIEAFYNLANKYGMNVRVVDWNQLYDLTESKPFNAILVLFNPLMNASGHIFYDAAPSCLLDPNEDGYIKQHSSYQKSLVYDWEVDRGLVFISIGSIQAPTKWIITRDGRAYESKDKEFSDKFFADTPGAFRGWGPNTIMPTRIGQTLHLHNWLGDYYLDTAILNTSIGSNNYYVYGLVKDTNWANPCYVKVGEGGWLFFGNGSNLDHGAFANDLTMIILHAPWNNEWLGPNAWHYDSGFKIYPMHGGILSIEDQISTGWIEQNISSFVFRILLLAENRDKGYYEITEIINDYYFES